MHNGYFFYLNAVLLFKKIYVFFCISTTMELTKRVEFIVVIISLVIITVDRCTCVFVAAVKQPTSFAEFHTRSPNIHTPRTDV